MIVGDIVRFKVYDGNKPIKELVGQVIHAFGHGVLRIVTGDELGSYQIWEFQAELVSDSEAMLWKLENL